MTRDERIEYLKEHVKKGRFRHSLAVEQTARKMAARFGLDEERQPGLGLSMTWPKT